MWLIVAELMWLVKSIYARFNFVNRSEKMIHIDAIRPSCGCIKVRMLKRDYAPGEYGEFYLQVDTANEESGPKEYTAEVAYSGETRAVFAGEI